MVDIRPAGYIFRHPAGLFVPLSAQPTRTSTLHSELSRAREYNNVYTVRSQKVLGDYQCLLRTTCIKRKSKGTCQTMSTIEKWLIDREDFFDYPYSYFPALFPTIDAYNAA